MAEGDYIDSWPLTALNVDPWGMTTDGANIWVLDNIDKVVYKYDMAGGYIDSWSLTALNADPRGIATDDTNIWVVDHVDDAVYKYNMAGGYIGVWSLTGANIDASGIATDGTNIWVVDWGTDLVYKYNMVGGYIDSWPLTAGNVVPYAIATDGINIWVVDPSTDLVYKYNMAGGYIDSWPLTGDNASPWGIATNGTNIWVVDRTTDAVYIYVGPPSVIHYFNSKSTSVWTDSGYMIDNILTNYATTAVNGAAEVLDGNTCIGDVLGTISKVELRAYGYGDGDDRIKLIPVFGGIDDGDEHLTVPTVDPDWVTYQDITTDTNSPSPWSWSDIQNLDCKVAYSKDAKANIMYCAKVEIRVTYVPLEVHRPTAAVGNPYMF